MTRLNFHAKELSDLYALRTFYDYLKERNSPFDIEFTGYTNSRLAPEMLSELLRGIPLNAKDGSFAYNTDNLVTPYSDIGGKSVGLRNLEIDVSILKNCVVPKTNSEKQELRKKHNIPTDRPVLVISYAVGTLNEYKLVDACKNLATIIFSGNVDGNKLYNTFPDLEGSPHLLKVNKYGALREIYALADVAVNSTNFVDTKDEIHNFIEATEGGPLFMVPSSESYQFGFYELAKMGVIKKCLHPDEIIERVQGYLMGWKGHDSLRRFRAEHLLRTREKYLPVLEQYLKHYFLNEPAPAHPDLVECRIESDDGRAAMRVSHKMTDWGCAQLMLYKQKEPSKLSKAVSSAADFTAELIEKTLDQILDTADYVNQIIDDKILGKKKNKPMADLCHPADDWCYDLPSREDMALLDFEYTTDQR